MRTLFVPTVAVVAVVLIVSGCGGTLANARKIDYRNARTLPSLEVPPDLSAAGTSGSGLPQGSATYSGFAGGQRARPAGSSAVLPEYSNVKLMRDGQLRYVVVNAAPDVVWGEVHDFLTQTGLSIEKEDPKAGLIETGWAENHALVGASSSNGLAKWLKSFYSTGTRDKYRVRLERGMKPGTTEVYLSHEGMEEVAPDTSGSSTNARPGWKPRPSDPDLEAEMLHRLVAHLGGSGKTETVVAKTPSAAGSAEASATESRAPPSARLTRNGNGAALLTLEDSLERAWRRVGLSLDRMGFTVEDRDRSKGIYYVRYIDPDTQAKEKGFFSRLFSGSERVPSNQYQVHVKPTDSGTNVEVLDKSGDPEASKTGERILSLLYEQLK